MIFPTWKEALDGHMPEELAKEIDVFELQLKRRQEGKIEEKLFAETRLRRGIYGQRYDNGFRHNGAESQEIGYREAAASKGPDTHWDAPGMQRIKIPYGILNPEQLELLADVAEEYSDAVLHVTTRQDIQLHFVHIEDTPELMRRLASVGITTREACGNSIRNVTACPISGVCHDEAFDTTPYAKACTYFLLGHPDAQNFGRKFKISFSGCEGHACGLAMMHDIGFVAQTREVDGKLERGFTTWVGGGLGAVPHQAKLFDDFVPEAEILPISQAMCRVFSRLGEKRNRARARLKFLVAKLGIDEFRTLVTEERAQLPVDPRWTDFLVHLHDEDEEAASPASNLGAGERSPEFGAWMETNIRSQKQAGYAVVHISLPLGDITSKQTRALAEITRQYSGGHIRATVEQNFLMRWVPEADLPDLYATLKHAGLHQGGAGTIVDITACPGTDTCKLGIAASRGLAAELHERLAAQALTMDEAVKNLRIKISGCFNACAQHQISDIGFYGVSRKAGARKVAHFQVVLGGQWLENAGSFGLAMGAIPSRNIPETVTLITQFFLNERHGDENFQAFIKRIGKPRVKTLLQDLAHVPAYEDDPSYFSDWGDPREYTLGDLTKGECAGEVVPFVEFGLAASEREVFEAQVKLDDGVPREAGALALKAMLTAAKALIQGQTFNIGDESDQIISEFRTRFFDTRLFFDPYAKGKFANYLFAAHEDAEAELNADQAHQRIGEAQLFIEAAHSCYQRLD